MGKEREGGGREGEGVVYSGATDSASTGETGILFRILVTQHKQIT